ncbi:MAG: RusA family crossover junction endodeoxyribonuclease [Selenomonadaceae bacterium]|nr:RusA family crossover junction endodeoxyribonuclease [Selenomonadaceae bacterium]
MTKIKFTAPLEPVPFPRPASNGKRRFNPRYYTDFKDALGLFAKIAMDGRAPFTSAIKITVHVYKKIIPTALTFGDWDNHGKAISDALNGICYVDDKQIVEAHIYLHKGTPRIEIELEAIT